MSTPGARKGNPVAGMSEWLHRRGYESVIPTGDSATHDLPVKQRREEGEN